MECLDNIEAVKQHLRPLQQEGKRIGFVPTMGALHNGHLALVDEAKKQADVVVVSIFVNPTQFGPNEDLDAYPRDLAGDLKKLEARGTDLVFTPSSPMIYPPGFQTRVEVLEATRGLCGAHRPTHFQGVTTVVLKLFAIVRPDVAVFGEKDFQQLTVLKVMARDLALDVEVRGAPTTREGDGLAMSSRNAYLSEADRQRAPAIYRGLQRARTAFDAGERDAVALLEQARLEMSAVGITPEYLELRRTSDLTPLDSVDEPGVILTAATVGTTRLIDNLQLQCDTTVR